MLVYFSPHRANAAAQCRCDLLERHQHHAQQFLRGSSQSSVGTGMAIMPTRNTATATSILKFPCVKKGPSREYPPVSGGCHKKSADSPAIRARDIVCSGNQRRRCAKEPFSASVGLARVTCGRRRCPARHAGHPHDPAPHRHPWPRSPAGLPQCVRRCRSRFGSADPDRAAVRRRRSG